MTHTPASGPFGPVTTPTMSSPAVTGAGSMPVVWQPDCASASAEAAAIKKDLTFICASRVARPSYSPRTHEHAAFRCWIGAQSTRNAFRHNSTVTNLNQIEAREIPTYTVGEAAHYLGV